jgi:hypothetical protein
MVGLRDKRGQARPHRLVAAVLALIGALLAFSGTAMAGQDELKGGSVVIQLQNSRGLKLKPKTISMPITGGAVDPVGGSGTVQVVGGFKAKRGKSKTQVKITTLTLGANGAQGSITAKVNKEFVANFGTLSGGAVARTGWGATISNIGATIAGPGAKALNRAFAPKKKHKPAKQSARRKGKVKGGQTLGTVVSIVTDPRSVEVVPGTGTLTLKTALMGAFASKLPQHCISPLTGVSAIPPASTQLLNPANFDFPVPGGSAAPDFSAGEVITAGGQTLTKDNGLLTPGSCSGSQPPVGTKLVSTDIGVDFAHNLLNSTAMLPTGASLRAPLANIDFSTGSRSFNSSTNGLTVSGATVRLSFPAALTLNLFFPSVSGPSDDFAEGDLIGTIDLTGVQLR